MLRRFSLVPFLSAYTVRLGGKVPQGRQSAIRKLPWKDKAAACEAPWLSTTTVGVIWIMYLGSSTLASNKKEQNGQPVCFRPASADCAQGKPSNEIAIGVGACCSICIQGTL